MHDIIFSIFPNENFVDLGLYQFGWEQCESAHSFGPATRNHYLFHYIISGMGTLMADDSKGVTQTYSVKSMQGFMIFPNQITTYIADKNLPWEYVWVEFDGLRVKSILESAGFTPDSPIYHARSKDLREEMMHEMLYMTQNRNSSPFHLIGHLYLFLDYLTRSSASTHIQQGSQLRDFYIHEALHFIEHNFQNDISVEDFLLNYRMAKAAELLKLTQLSIGDISNAVGYENQLHFSRAFKNIYGESPRAWRNHNRIGI